MTTRWESPGTAAERFYENRRFSAKRGALKRRFGHPMRPGRAESQSYEPDLLSVAQRLASIVYLVQTVLDWERTVLKYRSYLTIGYPGPPESVGSSNRRPNQR